MSNTERTPSPTAEDLQEQVRNHIKADRFNWNEALTGNEMLFLENLLLTFCPITQPGSIAYEKWKSHIAASQPAAKEATQEEAVELLKEIVEAVQRINAIGWEQSMTKAKEYLIKQSKQ